MSADTPVPVPYTRFLDENGQQVGDELPEFAQQPEPLAAMYRAMALTRSLDARAVALQRTGSMGTYPSALGQEAIGVGAASAMDADDVLVPTYREQSAMLWRGVTLQEMLRYWRGDERGCCYQAAPGHDFPISVPIATQILHAAGAAYALWLRRESRAVVSIFGDGASSKGDFYEAINFAGLWRLPVVFLLANNQWAISVPRSRQSAAPTLAQKAWAAGFAGEQVDGNDVIAVRECVARALAKARRGEGPTLIEALTYRLHDHTTADDASRYRSAEEVSAHWKEDPLVRLRAHLAALGAWTKADEQQLIEQCNADVQAAVEAVLAEAPPPPEAMFDYLHARLPEALAPQRREVAAGARQGRRDD